MKNTPFKLKGMYWKTGQSPIKSIDNLRSKYSAKQYVVDPSKKGLIDAASQFTIPPEDPDIERFFGEQYEYSASESELIKGKEKEKEKDKPKKKKKEKKKKNKVKIKFKAPNWLKKWLKRRGKKPTITVGKITKKILKD